MRRERRLTAVAWGLFLAWAIHDAEELATMPGWVERARPRLDRQVPWVPVSVWERFSVSRTHSALAIGLMGCLVAAAAARGARTGGQSPLFQASLMGFGLHAVPHLASAVLTRGYTPGVITAPTIVAPFSWWAWRQLRAADVPVRPVSLATLAVLPLSIVTAHAGAALLLRAHQCHNSA